MFSERPDDIDDVLAMLGELKTGGAAKVTQWMVLKRDWMSLRCARM
jgi:hypothetical protein